MISVVVQVHPSTLVWLQDRFSVSPVFLERLINVRVGVSGKTGNACFCRRNEHGRVIAIGIPTLEVVRTTNADTSQMASILTLLGWVVDPLIFGSRTMCPQDLPLMSRLTAPRMRRIGLLVVHSGRILSYSPVLVPSMPLLRISVLLTARGELVIAVTS